jgi:peptidoglycan hydrolase-like protein with peptidoglycan-binding domain
LGGQTRSAIEAYQRRTGLPVTGTPSVDLLRMLT